MHLKKTPHEKDPTPSLAAFTDANFRRLLIATILIATLVAILFWSYAALRKDFYNNLWAPAYLLMHGKSPYNTRDLNPTLPALWFPMAIGSFSFLGLFNEIIATKIWFLFNVGEIILLIFFSAQTIKSVYSYLLMVLLVYLFPPVLNNFILGQFSITFAAFALLSIYNAEKGQDWLAAFFLAVSLTKPQLAILSVFSIGMYFFRKNGVYGLLVFGLKTLIISFLMCIPLFFAAPNWISDWITNIKDNRAWLHPSLYSVFDINFGYVGRMVWAVITAIVAILFYRLHSIYSPRVVMIWGLALTTLVSPYLWSWDFVLIIPLWIYAFSVADIREKWLLTISHLFVWCAILYYQYTANGFNQVLWWIPLWMIAIIIIAMNFTSALKYFKTFKN